MTTPTLTNPTSLHTAIIHQDAPSITLRPVQSIDTIVEAYNEYNRLKERLLTENDYQTIKGRTCIKKSGFRKLACAFWISTEIMKENRINFEKSFVYEITVRATAPNWRFVEACASCSSIEKEFNHLENDVRATAQTRACNRAISDLIWGGEISAEELDDTKKTITTTPQIIQKTENKNPEPVMTQEELENSEPHMKGIVHKQNTMYETQDLMTVKQRLLLTKLIETKYKDEKTRASLFNRMLSLTKIEARFAIAKLLT